MTKLLSAQLRRLGRSVCFWGLAACCAVLGLLAMALAAYNTRNLGLLWLLSQGHSYFFMIELAAGFFSALFAAFFLGEDRSCGALRNKLWAGHARRDLYLCHLLLCAGAGLFFTLCSMLPSLLAGRLLLGPALWEALDPAPWRFACILAVQLFYAALFCLPATLDARQARACVLSLLLAAVLAVAGAYTTGRLRAPALQTQMVLQSDGSFLREEVPNAAYLQGNARAVFTALDAASPFSLSLRTADREESFAPLPPLCLLAEAGLLTALGLAIFQKQDIQ